MSTTNAEPIGYTTPEFPSLYWPFQTRPGQPHYLYSVSDIWRFTLYWTLISIVSAHTIVAASAVAAQIWSACTRRRRGHLITTATSARTPTRREDYVARKNRKLLGENPLSDTLKWVWVIPALYIVVGTIEAFAAGSLVGLVLGAVYTAGLFRMSVWTPLFWGIINMLVLILSSFRISGGL